MYYIQLIHILTEGTLEGYNVSCPWHASKFGVRTGEPTKPLERQPLLSYEVKVGCNNILLKTSMITNILNIGSGGKER
jgi:nitrite reductase/ring-hydroxylating ferredoxin subunit